MLSMVPYDHLELVCSSCGSLDCGTCCSTLNQALVSTLSVVCMPNTCSGKPQYSN